MLTLRPYREHGTLIDLPGRLIRLAKRNGLGLCSREVALLCGLKDDRLALRASFFQLYHQRAGTIERMLLIGHEDVLVFSRAARTQSRRGKR